MRFAHIIANWLAGLPIVNRFLLASLLARLLGPFKKKLSVGLSSIFILLFSLSVHSSNPVDIETYLKKFHEYPSKTMNERLTIRDQFGFVLPPEEGLWPKSEDEDRTQVAEKIRVREKLCQADENGECFRRVKLPAYAEYTPVDDVKNLLYAPYITNLAEMDRRNLMLHVLNPGPWSDSYWPVYKGGLGNRYLDSRFPGSRAWIDNYNHFLSVPSSSVATNLKSPSEKYDLLLGDHSYTLTRQMWREGKVHYYDVRGSVPIWVGYCHGWAPASFLYREPTKSVRVQAKDGREIKFTPSDIKALASLLWGEAPPVVGFIGDVCRKSNIKQDPANGRILDPECFDVNPASWHIGLINQVGIQKRSMIMDSVFSREIWNFPISGYRYKYFNTQTLRESSNLAGSVIPVRQFTIDKFKKYRSKRATHIVGVALDIGYVGELGPTSAEGPRKAPQKVIRFLYDLELDQSGNIIGGEWYSNHRPDFVWNPFPPDKFLDRRALSVPEKNLGALPSWSGQTPVSDEITELGKRASKLEQPLNVVVEKLIELSHQQQK